MTYDLGAHLANWRANPRRWNITYVLSRLLITVGTRLDVNRVAENYQDALDPPIEAEFVDILFDSAFRRSVSQVKGLTCLDVARLANLWNLVQFASPGIFLEVGSYRGGTALHICNAMEQNESRFYCFDPFETGGFETLDDWQTNFKTTDFMDTKHEAVVRLLSSKPHAEAICGFFPKAAEGINLHNIAFCHLDVDMYDATLRSLEYLVPRLALGGFIVIDDVGHRETPGVAKAVTEFIATHQSFLVIPMFPCQAILLAKSLW